MTPGPSNEGSLAPVYPSNRAKEIVLGRIYDATWGRAFSAAYDRGFKGAEDAGLREMRRELLAQAQGRVLELGAGTGLNLEHYPEPIESLTLVEPDPHMTRQLRE